MTLADRPSYSPDQMSQFDKGANRPRTMSETSGVNVGETERLISGAAGAALVVLGLSRRSLPGVALAAVGGAMAYRGLSGHCSLYSALGIDTAHGETDGAAPEEYFNRGLHFQQTFTISNKSPEELYTFWRDFTNLPQIFQHLESVTPIDDKRSHWVAKGPMGMKFEWDAEVINDEPNTTIAWRSLSDAQVDNAGSVRFVRAPGDDRGTELKVTMDYIPPAGAVGKALAAMLGQDPESLIREDLRRFKRVQETGEIPTTEGQPQGNCKG